MKSMVYATEPNALNIKHPTDGPLKMSGSLWEMDGFTCRMIVDGVVTDDPTKALKPDNKPSLPSSKSDVY